MTQQPTVAIFAGSRLPEDPQVLQIADELGTALGRVGIAINYGAGTQGLMGQVALAVARAGGQVFAYALERYESEPQVKGALCITLATEQERFAHMTTMLQPIAMIVLPGGPGAIREALQALEAAVYDQGPPVILVKAGTYLDGIKHYFDGAVTLGLIKPEHQDKLKLLTVSETIAFLTSLTKAQPEPAGIRPTGP